MSKVFDSLRQAELTAAERKQSETTATYGMLKMEDRRTRRALVQIPLRVYGYTSQGNPFYEEASTLEINAHGALIVMKTAVPPGDQLLLTRETDERTQVCTVRAVTARRGQYVEVAIAFAAPAPRFWGKIRQEPSQKCL